MLGLCYLVVAHRQDGALSPSSNLDSRRAAITIAARLGGICLVVPHVRSNPVAAPDTRRRSVAHP